jgi:hypothetical protein
VNVRWHKRDTMNNTSWRHHYIPQFYLNGFTSKERKFQIFNIQKNRFVKNGKDFSTESYFFEKNGNTLISENRETDFIEKHYGKIDSRISEVFNRINKSSSKDKFSITDNDIAMLQHFIGVMYWRIPTNLDKAENMISQKKLKELGLLIKRNNETIEDPALEKRLKNDNNFIKAIRSSIANLSYPEIFNCNIPLHIIPFPEGLPAICSDNPIICREPNTFLVYSDDFIFPINSTKIFIRGKKLKKFRNKVKVLIDLIIFKQAKNYVSCTDETYIDELNNIFEKYSLNLNELRIRLFNEILERNYAT